MARRQDTRLDRAKVHTAFLRAVLTLDRSEGGLSVPEARSSASAPEPPAEQAEPPESVGGEREP